MNAKERTVLTQMELYAQVSHDLAREAGISLSKMAKAFSGIDTGNNVKNFQNIMNSGATHALSKGVAIHNLVTALDNQAKGDAIMDMIRRLRK